MNEKSLISVKLNEVKIIIRIELNDELVKRQLANLGFLVGEKIKLLKYNYNKKSYLVKVMNINYAVDKKICEGIFVGE